MSRRFWWFAVLPAVAVADACRSPAGAAEPGENTSGRQPEKEAPAPTSSSGSAK